MKLTRIRIFGYMILHHFGIVLIVESVSDHNTIYLLVKKIGLVNLDICPPLKESIMEARANPKDLTKEVFHIFNTSSPSFITQQ